MAPVELPDPSMHTIYIVDPTPDVHPLRGGLRLDGTDARGGPGRFPRHRPALLSRLRGACRAFSPPRYLFALIAIVPAYVLMRRLYGIHAGVIAIIVLLSCPVILTAWGTDYPDSAVVSYVGGSRLPVSPCPVGSAGGRPGS